MSSWSLHVAEGAALLPSLIDALSARGVEDGVVRLSGALAAVEIVAAPGAAPFALEGPAWLVDGHYRAHPGSVALMGTVSWSDQGLPRVAAGRLQGAISGGVDAVVTTIGEAGDGSAAPTPRARAPRATSRDERIAAAALDLQDALPPTPAPVPAPTPSPPSSPAKASGGGWSSAVAASQRPRGIAGSPSPDELGFDQVPDLSTGDVLVHPRFGRCRVARPPVSDKVKVRRPTGALIDLHLRVCRFFRQPDEDGRRVFRLEIGQG